jgi:hypothetical protein
MHRSQLTFPSETQPEGLIKSVADLKRVLGHPVRHQVMRKTFKKCVFCDEKHTEEQRLFDCACTEDCPVRFRVVQCPSSGQVRLYQNEALHPSTDQSDQVTRTRFSEYPEDMREKILQLNSRGTGGVSIRKKLHSEHGLSFETMPTADQIDDFIYRKRPSFVAGLYDPTLMFNQINGKYLPDALDDAYPADDLFYFGSNEMNCGEIPAG